MKQLQLLVLFAISLFIIGCSDKEQSTLSDFKIKQYEPSHAKGFNIVGAEGLKSSIIEVYNPWQGSDNIVTRLFISRDGEAAPAGFEGQKIDEKAQRIICMSSTHVAMLDALDSVSNTVGVLGRDYVSNPYIIGHRDKIGDIGREGQIDYELILSLDPDIVLLFGLDGASPLEAKLKELQIPYIYIGEYLEKSPLGKAEWMVAIAEMIGKRDSGRSYFAAIPQRYKALSQLIKEAKLTCKPKVMINTPYRDSWVMAPCNAYVAQLIDDAGGHYIYKDDRNSTKYQSIDIEEAYKMVFQSDLWINVGTLSSLDELKNQFPKFADAPCVLKGAVYNANKKTNAMGGNDYWESGVIRPDIVLRDLISIFHPEILKEELIYYHQLK